ncbi:hypothetical protein GCM10027169_39370 [Gordonia jinhuaensis]|uniref:Uncharacterized protein n=1 Tax=Gordonia jinhuaensis TaxID=1517702 RepID=A0A916T1F4_9ACTN|nr:hypothetical protein [Gordonia jinhuaensis]GGB24571.1 hypothetical protein GCM10011489_11000 [Gordonia jinhuaensis]
MTEIGSPLTTVWGAAPALAGWAAAWRAGDCSPDDVLDALHDLDGQSVLTHQVGVADIETAGELELRPTGEGTDALLRILRAPTVFEVLTPAPGDTMGLPAGPVRTAALNAGELVVLRDPRRRKTFCLIAHRADRYTLVWTLHSCPQLRTPVPRPLCEVEYELREAVREVTDILSRLSGRTNTPEDLRARLHDLTARRMVDLPPTADDRVHRVIAQAAQVGAIADLALQSAGGFGVTGTHQDTGETALRRLADLARVARMTAVNTAIARFGVVEN